jgi:group I intron endonuclease
VNSYTKSTILSAFSSDILSGFTTGVNMKTGIYCIENLVNGKRYIGKGKNIISRMNHPHKSSTYLFNAINKYGNENFHRYIIEYCEPEMLAEREQYYIREWKTKAPNGYNLTDGGEGCLNPSEETRRKMSESRSGENHPLFGKTRSEETRRKMRENHSDVSGENNGFFGKTHSEETRKKMSESAKNRPPISDETRKKSSEARKGKTRSEETRERMRKGWIKRKEGE